MSSLLLSGCVSPAFCSGKRGGFVLGLNVLFLAMLFSPKSLYAGEASGDSLVIRLEPVSVTARRGTENAQEIPFSISVISGSEIAARRSVDFEDVLRSSPGVDVNSGGGDNDTNIRIRGVGALYPVSADDGSVTINVNGAPMSSRFAQMATFDIERVEILKGPQGTLFGRNSEAGAINITTRKPTRETEGYLRSEVGGEGRYLLEGAVGGPVSETVSARVALRRSGSDSPVMNEQDGEPVTKPRDMAMRGSVLWQPGEKTSVLFLTEYEKIEDRLSMMVLRPYGDNPSLDLTPGHFESSKETVHGSAELNHDLYGFRMTSVSSYLKSDWQTYNGSDISVNSLWMGIPMELIKEDAAEERSFSQDLRLGSLPDSKVFWVAGLNLSRTERSFDTDMPSYSTVNLRDFETNAYAVYGEITYPLSDALKVTGGLRHTWEEKTYSASYETAGMILYDDRSLSDNYSTGRVALSYAVATGTNIYGVFARGYKAGGFNDYATSSLDSDPYDPAIVNNFEVGFKHESGDRRFMLNGALFYNDVKDDHLLGYDPSKNFATVALNADTESKGFELEGCWRAGGGLTLRGGVTYIDGGITSHVTTNTAAGDVEPGNRMPDIPKWSAMISAEYSKALGGLFGAGASTFNARIGYRYVGKRAADPQNNFELDAYHKVDARIGLGIGNGEVYVWGDNLLDERYDHYGYYMISMVSTIAPFTVGWPSMGRTIGLGAAYYF